MPESLCESCRWMREVKTARSRFVLCERSKSEPAYPKYPPQPVVRCLGHEPKAEQGMTLPIYHDSCFTFRFADDRIIPRFHVAESPGLKMFVIKTDPQSGRHLDLLATATVGDGGWVDLPQPITVRAGESFIAASVTCDHETKRHHEGIRQLNRLAFGGDDEARLVDALRAGGHAALSIVAVMNREVVGHILFSHLSIVTATGTIPALALAPMAVLPMFQRHGLGSALVRGGLRVCKEQGHRIVVVLGHAGFYPRFGFTAKLAEPLQSPFGSGPSHMAIELAPGALDGVTGTLVYAPPFGEL